VFDQAGICLFVEKAQKKVIQRMSSVRAVRDQKFQSASIAAAGQAPSVPEEVSLTISNNAELGGGSFRGTPRVRAASGAPQGGAASDGITGVHPLFTATGSFGRGMSSAVFKGV
jgi:hypothetical protein